MPRSRDGRWWSGGRTGASVTVVVAITACTSVLAHIGWLDGFETAALDAFLRLRPHREAKHVVLVRITDEDYEALFGGASPLDREALRDVLMAVQRGNPAVIGVDLETNPLDRLPIDEAEAVMAWPPVVWGVADGVGVKSVAGGATFGLALMPRDADGVVRRHRRWFRDLSGNDVPSLPWAIANAYCESVVDAPVGCDCAMREVTEGSLLLNFSGDRYTFESMSVKSALLASTGKAWGTIEGPLFGKIALVGGQYSAARDMHTTPLGEMSGVEVVGQAIESELSGGGIRTTNEIVMVLMEIVGGFAIVFFHKHFRVKIAFWLSIVGIPLIAGASSLASFYSLSRWANFAPVLVGVLIHQLYEGALTSRSRPT